MSDSDLPKLHGCRDRISITTRPLSEKWATHSWSSYHGQRIEHDCGASLPLIVQIRQDTADIGDGRARKDASKEPCDEDGLNVGRSGGSCAEADEDEDGKQDGRLAAVDLRYWLREA